MITESFDSIFDSPAEAWVNTINCVGVMGKGLALTFKQKFPDYFLDYKAKCANGEIEIGKVTSYRLPDNKRPKWILNFPTKAHWRYNSKLIWIRSGIDSLWSFLINSGCNSVAIPALGCSNGGLDWQEVRPIIVDRLSILDGIDVILYPPREYEY